MTGSPKRAGRALAVLLACLAVSLFCVIYPVYVIRPFRAQGARELMIALFVTRFRPGATVVSAIAALIAAIAYWRARPNWWPRALAVLGVAFVSVLAALARVNIYELMFHPNEHPSFAAADQVKLDKGEMVIAVRIGGAARAYPIRDISYHHVINDVVDKVAIAATY